MARTFVVLGLTFLALGLLWPVLSRIGLGRLPGDIVIRRPGWTLWFPWVTCLLVSAALTALAWLLRR
jgi:Protein of unknown function (DUF2905)